MKIIETKHLVIDGKDIVQVRYELDSIVNDTPMYTLDKNKLVPLV